MKLFGRKDDAASRDRRRYADGNGNALRASRRLTLNLTRAEKFAAMLAKSRASHVMEVADLLAGMYICDWDRLSRYWEAKNHEEVETFLQSICQISPQRWHSWIQLYDQERHKEEGRRIWRLFIRLKKEPPSEPRVQESTGLGAVLRQAEQIAPFRDTAEGRSIPILTSECVLLCIARNYGSEISRKLAATGLDAAKLEQDALFPKRAPLA
ncbi:MAG: hypothetical protein ABR953_08535 [Candidatus Acidiferrales bacterium]|jgi:hypothetical protein